MKSLILGGPGAGKTTRLISIVEQALNSGLKPEDICYVSFTKKAINEAVERCAKIPGIRSSQFKYFKTIHALAYWHEGIQRNEVFNNTHLAVLSLATGYDLETKFDEEDELKAADAGTKMLFLCDLMRNKWVSPDVIVEQSNLDLNVFEFKRFYGIYKRYKTEKGLVDFTDILVKYHTNFSPLDVKMLIVDEAQDLSSLQWKIIDKLSTNIANTYYAGDDDQAIYRWSGADVDKFLGLAVDNIEVLEKSHRLPKKIFELSQTIVHRIDKRYEKEWTSRDEEGSIQNYVKFEHVQFNKHESWLVLARTNRIVDAAKRVLRARGIIFKTKFGSSIDPDELKGILLHRSKPTTLKSDEESLMVRMSTRKYADMTNEWYVDLDKIPKWRSDYYRIVLSEGYKLTDPPNIFVDTIHGAKGGEADNVVLFTDTSKDGEDDDRVFYVGVTRAKHNLHIILPMSQNYYRIEV